MTQCHYSDHNLKMIIIIKAIIGFEISFWTEFFQIPQFDTGSGVWWRTTHHQWSRPRTIKHGY